MTLKGNVTKLDDTRVTNPDYPEQRAEYEGRGRLFPWRQRDLGQLALCILYFWVDSKASIAQLVCTSDFAQFGITRDAAYNRLRQIAPHVLEDYRIYCGREMPRDLPIKRIYMWFLKAQEKGCRKTVSPEHPLRWAEPDMLDRALKLSLRDGT